MDNLELVSFQIISAVGVAKSSYIEAMEIAEKGDFDLEDYYRNYGRDDLAELL